MFNAMKSQDFFFQKSQKVLWFSGWEFEADNSSYGVQRNPAIEIAVNSY